MSVTPPTVSYSQPFCFLVCIATCWPGASLLWGVVSWGVSLLADVTSPLRRPPQRVSPWAQVLNEGFCGSGSRWFHPAAAHSLGFECPCHFWELDICLSSSWEWLCFYNFPSGINNYFGHIDQRSFYRIVFSISLISWRTEKELSWDTIFLHWKTNYEIFPCKKLGEIKYSSYFSWKSF